MTTRTLAVGALFALLMGCVSPAQRETARQEWEAHDLERARECRGAAMHGSCIGGGGP
jgi:hypothetical protein